MTADPGDNANGRVTLALLAYKIDQLAEQVSEMRKDIKCLSADQQADRVILSRHENEINTHGDEIDKLRSVQTFWGGINSAAAVVAGIIGWQR